MLGIVLGIIVMVFCALKRWNAVICSVAGALVVGLLNGIGVWSIFNDLFFPAVGRNVTSFMVIFLCSAIYARLIADSGCAASIAYFILDKLGKKRMVFAVLATTCVLIYGGVSVFVVFFLVWPICLMLAKEADIPKRLFVPVIYAGGLGAFALAMPGAPSASNIIAAQSLNVSASAAPISSIIATVIMTLFSYWYLTRLQARYEKKGMHFDADLSLDESANLDRSTLPKIGVAILPLIVVVVLYIALSNNILGAALGSTPAICASMVFASFLVIVMNYKQFANVRLSVGKGVMEALSPLISLAAVLAFSAVVQSTDAFAHFVEMIKGMPGHPLFQVLVAANVIGFVTASSSGTVTLTLECFGEFWLAAGVNAQVLTRVMALSSNILSFGPHSGGLFTVLDVSKESHKTVFIESFIAAAVPSLIGAIVVIGLYFIGIV